MPRCLDDPRVTVVSVPALLEDGWTLHRIRDQLAARRWQRVGRAIVLHNGPLRRGELARAVLLSAGPRAALTAFTAAEECGLRGWERETVHIVIPGGARVHRPDGVRVRVHRVADWSSVASHVRHGVLTAAPAIVACAAALPTPRSACGVLAAGVQQRLTTAARLAEAAELAIRMRHRRVALTALADIGQGSHALSEIDLVRLCRKHRLPLPVRQAVRVTRSGRRRYFDAEWVRPDGRRVVVEIDGALHLIVGSWWDDQLRQNEVVLSGRTVLRFPSVVLRYEEAVVVDQLTRALLG